MLHAMNCNLGSAIYVDVSPVADTAHRHMMILGSERRVLTVSTVGNGVIRLHPFPGLGRGYARSLPVACLAEPRLWEA
jgi:hypothetical protein